MFIQVTGWTGKGINFKGNRFVSLFVSTIDRVAIGDSSRFARWGWQNKSITYDFAGKFHAMHTTVICKLADNGLERQIFSITNN